MSVEDKDRGKGEGKEDGEVGKHASRAARVPRLVRNSSLVVYRLIKRARSNTGRVTTSAAPARKEEHGDALRVKEEAKKRRGRSERSERAGGEKGRGTNRSDRGETERKNKDRACTLAY